MIGGQIHVQVTSVGVTCARRQAGFRFIKAASNFTTSFHFTNQALQNRFFAHCKPFKDTYCSEVTSDIKSKRDIDYISAESVANPF